MSEVETSSVNVEAATPQVETSTAEVDVNTTATETAPAVEQAEAGQVPEASEKPVQSHEENAKYAAARRRAEAEYSEKLAAEQAKTDEVFKSRFGNFKNPVTGKPIEGMQDYLDAVEAQQKLDREEQLRQKGLDPHLIDDMVAKSLANSPEIQQAKAIIAETNANEAQRQIEADIKAISQMDPEIHSVEDIAKQENWQTVLGYVQNNGLNLVDAYRLANSDRLVARQTAAVKQAAINNAKSQSHMETTRGVATSDGTLVPIPERMADAWRQAYPDLTKEQLLKKYNEAIK